MALVKCKECGSEISDSAKLCPQCGFKPPKTKWWLWGPVLLVVGVFILAAINGPKNTLELGKMEEEKCLRRQGDGEWVASSGISLERFCRTKGNLEAIKAACQIDPSKC